MKFLVSAAIVLFSFSAHSAQPLNSSDLIKKAFFEKGLLEKFESVKGPAGCLVNQGGKMLVVSTKKGKGKLSPPAGGAAPGENVLQTAFRETFEETGSIVKIKSLFHKFEAPFYLFNCELVHYEADGDGNFKMPPEFKKEINFAKLIPFENLSAKDWRFPTDFPIIKKAF